MKHIVITGSTRGIGYALAEAFLQRGCSVMVSGRGQAAVELAMEKLAALHGAERLSGQACDMRQPALVQALWAAAKTHFQTVDIWINNAGYSGPQVPAWQMPPETARAVVETNLLGVMYGSTIAAQGMLEQGSGAIYNMEGMGSDGRKHTGLSYYGTTKYGLHYYTSCLADELHGSPLVIGALRPGMVLTDMILEQYKDSSAEEWERARKVFNLLAERVEVVAARLAGQMLSNQRSGVTLRYMTMGKLLGRMLVRLLRHQELIPRRAGNTQS